MSKNSFLSSLYKQDEVISQKKFKKVEWIKTFSPSLNRAMGGGMPIGYMVQFAGKPSSGKSLMATLCAAKWQQHFGDNSLVIYADFEHSTSDQRLRQLGLDTSDGKFLLYKDVDCDGAKFFDFLHEKVLPGCIENGIKPYIIVDSKDSIMPPGETGRKSGEMEYASMAKFLKRVLKISVGMLGACDGTMVIVNQIVDKIGVMYGPTATTSGGNALKHNSCLDVWFDQSGKKDDKIIRNNETVGHKVRFKIAKNKLSQPHRKGIFYILYEGKVINQHLEVLEMIQELGVVGRPTTRSWQVDDKVVYSSKKEFIVALENDKKLLAEMVKRCNEPEKWAAKFKVNKDSTEEDLEDVFDD